MKETLVWMNNRNSLNIRRDTENANRKSIGEQNYDLVKISPDLYALHHIYGKESVSLVYSGEWTTLWIRKVTRVSKQENILLKAEEETKTNTLSWFRISCYQELSIHGPIPAVRLTDHCPVRRIAFPMRWWPRSDRCQVGCRGDDTGMVCRIYLPG